MSIRCLRIATRRIHRVLSVCSVILFLIMDGSENRDLQRMTVPQLRKFLTDRGVPCNGKRRDELLSLASKAATTYDVIQPCDREESLRKRRRVTAADGSERDFNGKAVNWKAELAGLPSISSIDIFVYLSSYCDWTPERLKNHKRDDGYRMFTDGHVEMVEVGVIEGDKDFVYVRGRVKPEQRQLATRYATWVLCSTTGEIKSAGCACVASDAGSCKHVVCLLFTVENFISRQMDGGKAVSTDKPCTWNKPRKESRPVTASHLDFRRNKTAPKKPTPSTFRPLKAVNDETIIKLRDQLAETCRQVNPRPLLLSMVDRPLATSPPPSMSQLISNFRSSSSSTDITTYLQENTSLSDRLFFKELQQEDPAWLDARVGRITASLAGDIMSLRDTSEGKSLVSRILGTAKSFSSPAVEYGRKMEGVARHLYEEKMTTEHKSFSCHTTGLHIMEDRPYLGASPDAIVSCKCHGVRLVEIKCSSKHRNLLAKDIPRIDPGYHLELINDQLHLKTSSKWYLQMQYQMGVIGVQNCDFVMYTRGGITVLPINFSAEVWAGLKEKATRVFCERIFPRL